MSKERGYVQEMYKELSAYINSKFRTTYRTYYGLEEYLQEYLKIKTLDLKDFELLFKMFFLAEIGFFIAFSAVHFLKFLIRII